MKRTTISLPDDLAVVVAREAKRRDMSVSEWMREAATKNLEPNGGQKHRFSFIGIANSGATDVAENFEEYLDQAWADDIAADRDDGPRDR
jgi:hypothetical protein